jgi:hypothetical protein
MKEDVPQQPERKIGTADTHSKPSSQLSSNSQTSVRAVEKPISSKRDKSNIFKAFAKAKPKKKILDSEPSGGSGMESV